MGARRWIAASDGRPIRMTLLAALCVAAGGLLLVYAARKGVTVIVEGEPRAVTTYASTVGSLLADLAITLGTADQIQPAPSERLVDGSVITLRRAHTIYIWADGEGQTLVTTGRIVANLLALAGVELFPEDEVYLDGTPVPLDEILPMAPGSSLQVVRAKPVVVALGAKTRVFHSTAATLGQALWEAGIGLHEADRVFPALDTPLTGRLQATVVRSREMSIQVGGQTIRSRSAARTVGEALAEVGLSLQGLDYSEPPEDAPLPLDGRIRVVQVREEVILEQVPLAFETVYQPDPGLELDSQRILEPGLFGLEAVRRRIRYEDGVEISREEEDAWVAVDPQPRVMGYGTQVVVRTVDTPDGSLDYWREVTAYATSYSPCRIFRDRCSSITASGATLRKGVAAVVPYWYASMAGSRVYVPGYGVATILDTGRGIPGRNWIDLGYDDDNFVSWHRWVTVYFLTPVPPPGNILYLLR